MMRRYSWANAGGSFVICHASTKEMYSIAPFGIVSSVFGADRWELIEILEGQDGQG
jgi:hypothetical protein